MNLLRRQTESVSEDLEQKLGDLNIFSESHTDNSVVGDFGDIVPVDVDVAKKNGRKHQKWTIGEQKKLISLINERKLSQLAEDEWNDIAGKLDRTRNSVYYKAKELLNKTNNRNKKQKVIEHSRNSVNDATSSVSLSRNDRDISSSVAYSDIDVYTESQGRIAKSDCLFMSRKKAIKSVLEEMPGRRGTKNMIFEAIQYKYNIALNDKSSSQYKGFQQCLSKYFRNMRGFYGIRTNCIEYQSLNERLKTIGKFDTTIGLLIIYFR